MRSPELFNSGFIFFRMYTGIMKKLLEFKKVHFIGIGGIGMSAMAKYLRHHNIIVTGSDRSESEITKDLEHSFGISVYIGVNPENVTIEHDALVYSPAVPENDPERQEASNRDVPQYSYPELLGMISQELTTIAISGTNGKTTTTSMVILFQDNLIILSPKPVNIKNHF